MITINGKKYAKNDAEFTESLFNPGGTCVGYYKKLKNGIQLMTMQKELFAFMVNNSHNERFFVSAGRLENGKAFYMYGLSDSAARWLGIENMGCIDRYELIGDIYKTLFTDDIKNKLGKSWNNEHETNY